MTEIWQVLACAVVFFALLSVGGIVIEAVLVILWAIFIVLPWLFLSWLWEKFWLALAWLWEKTFIKP